MEKETTVQLLKHHRGQWKEISAHKTRSDVHHELEENDCLLTCMGNIRTSITEPRSEATPSSMYRRVIEMMIRNGADHKL